LTGRYTEPEPPVLGAYTLVFLLEQAHKKAAQIIMAAKAAIVKAVELFMGWSFTGLLRG